ncbi:MAG TPA: hypothetical protein PKM97_08830 [Bacteroidia bacterium]|nr:hypothetical protein [Bacteroidia bacterium]
MKNQALSLLCIGIFLCSGISNSPAQDPSSIKPAMKKDQLHAQGKKAAPGTYQFIVTPSEAGDPFTNDYLVMIENYRDQNEERVLALTQLTKVRIPSRADIEKPDYKPLTEIVYTKSYKPTSRTR